MWQDTKFTRLKRDIEGHHGGPKRRERGHTEVLQSYGVAGRLDDDSRENYNGQRRRTSVHGGVKDRGGCIDGDRDRDGGSHTADVEHRDRGLRGGLEGVDPRDHVVVHRGEGAPLETSSVGGRFEPTSIPNAPLAVTAMERNKRVYWLFRATGRYAGHALGRVTAFFKVCLRADITHSLRGRITTRWRRRERKRKRGAERPRGRGVPETASSYASEGRRDGSR